MGGPNITNTWAHEQQDRWTKTVIGTREARDHRDQGNRPVIRQARGRQDHRTSHEQDRTLGWRLLAFPRSDSLAGGCMLSLVQDCGLIAAGNCLRGHMQISQDHHKAMTVLLYNCQQGNALTQLIWWCIVILMNFIAKHISCSQLNIGRCLKTGNNFCWIIFKKWKSNYVGVRFELMTTIIWFETNQDYH